MTSKKLQNFVRSKVNTHSNVSISFSKAKTKSDSLEEPLFSNDSESPNNNELDSDREKVVCDTVEENTNNDNQPNSENLDFEMFSADTLNTPDGSNPVPARSRVEIIGKSVNTAFKDAQSALSAIKENAKKRSIRKPSDITKGRSKFNLSKKKAQELMNETDDKNNPLSSTKKEEIMKAFNVIPETELKANDNVGFVSDDVVNNVVNMEVNEVKTTISKDVISEDNEQTKMRGDYQIVSAESNVKQTNKPNFNVNSNSGNSNEDLHHSSSFTASDLVFNFTSLKILGIIGGLISVFFFFSVSKFILGLVCGLLMAFGIFKLYESLYLSDIEDQLLPGKTVNYPHLRSYPNPIIPHVEETPLKDEYASPIASYSAWVNAVNEYTNTTNHTNSYTLHISLEGTKLRMKRTKQKLTSRHFIGDTAQLIIPPTFISERVVELLHSHVHLLPYGLAKRRIWSKKYPICIVLSKQTNDKTSNSSLTNPFMSPSRSSDNLESLKMDANFLPTTGSSNNTGLPVGSTIPELNLYFFPENCREKEEMYRRFMAASLGMPITLTISDIIDKYLLQETKIINQIPVPLVNSNIAEDDDSSKANDSSSQRKVQSTKAYQPKEPNIVTYFRFMAKFMPSDNYMFQMKSQNMKLNYVDCEPELLWLNALIGRLAWDVFRGTFWMKVIREKIQKKLRKLSLPYFMNQLEVHDVDLGTELPVIRKVSRPYLDNRGLWVECNMVYAGGFSMELETKVNLMKLKEAANQYRKTKHSTHSSSQGSAKSTQPADIGVRYVPSADVLMPANTDSPRQQQGQGSQGSSPESNTKPNVNLNDSIVIHSTQEKTPTNDSEEKDMVIEGTDLSVSGEEDIENQLQSTDNISNENNNMGELVDQKSKANPGLNEVSSDKTSSKTSVVNSRTSDETQSSIDNSMIPLDDFDPRDTVKSSLNEVLSSNSTIPSSLGDQMPIDSYESEDFDENWDKVDSNDTHIPNGRLMNLFERITKSSYFQKASENKYVQKTMEYVSNTTLRLQVTVQYLEGTLVLNIPPPPSDRLWCGFKKDVTLILKAKPKVGQKEISMTKIVEFIEKQLLQEFRKVVVLPNMDDINIPLLLNGDPDNYSQNLL